jgi:hypothetical protein
MAFFGDHPHSYLDGYNGGDIGTLPQPVSKVHKLQWWDINFEWFMTLVGFGYYMDLVSIIKPQGAARDKFISHRSNLAHGSTHGS